MFKKLFDKFTKDETKAETKDDEMKKPQDIEPATPVNTSALSEFAEKKEEEKAERRAVPSDLPPLTDEGAEDLRGRIEDALRTVYDPEIPVNIYDIGLIYEITPREDRMVYVKMTLTSPSCPAAGILPGQVESKARSVEGVHDVELDLVFDPPWTPDLMSEAAKLELGML